MSHDPSEIILICWFGVWGTFLILITENSCSAYYFVWIKCNCATICDFNFLHLFIYFYFFYKWQVRQKKNLFKIEIFYNILYIFTEPFKGHCGGKNSGWVEKNSGWEEKIFFKCFAFSRKTFAFSRKTFAFPRETLRSLAKLLRSLAKIFAFPRKT